MNSSTQKKIELIGARMHNLKNVNVSFQRNAFTVVTGVSGSGKSSLVFDTLYAEGQRRYVESLSSYARQFLGRLDKPEVDYINGLTPCVAIEQKVNTRNPRSTVATSTEIYDYLKLLFTRAGKTYSPISGHEVKCHSVDDVVDFILAEARADETVFLLTNIPFENAEELSQVLDLELQKGYSRLVYKDKVVKIADFSEKKVRSKDVRLLIDRLLVPDTFDDEYRQRLNDSVQTAFYEGRGELTVQLHRDGEIFDTTFSNRFELDGMTFEQPTINFLSFNNPFGACGTCQGFGSVVGIDSDLVIQDTSLSLYEGCVVPWRGETMGEWKKAFIRSADAHDFPIHKPYRELTQKERSLLWHGAKGLRGIDQFFEFLKENAYKIQYRVMMARYRGKTICPDCRGTRLRKDAGYVQLNATKPLAHHGAQSEHRISLPEVLLLNVKKARELFESLELSDEDQKIADRILVEINSRLGFLDDVGLSYLGLNRLSNTLSGGESQRINLATTLGSSLVGSTYVLDEPSIGLHSRDTERLITVIERLRDTGNTVVVVEHDEEIMYSADELVDIGPHAGVNGGEVVFQGDFNALKYSDTLTADYLNHRLKVTQPQTRRSWNNFLWIKNARKNNLKNIDVKIPLHAFTAVTGVSGSGKTTLIKGVLYSQLLRALEQFSSQHQSNAADELAGDVRLVNAVELVDQNPIGKSSRSNPVTYIKAYDQIRDLFADQVISKQRGYKSSIFSFNVDGGRCDNCKGEGEEIIEMQFMADLHLPCEVCKGSRFKSEVLDVTYKGKNISDILSMTVDEAMEFFKDVSMIHKRLQPLQDVGLGYIALGQSSNTLSGGEAQRIKLASFLSKSSKDSHTVFIFDEPTTGLHFNDVEKLMKSFQALVDMGNTIVTIEHNLDVIGCADWVIDLGPDGGEAGGSVVFEGTPEELAKSSTITGRYFSKKESGAMINPALKSV